VKRKYQHSFLVIILVLFSSFSSFAATGTSRTPRDFMPRQADGATLSLSRRLFNDGQGGPITGLAQLGLLGRNVVADTSPNWAGYAITGGPTGSEYVEAFSDWTVPSLSCEIPNSRISTWVGIDGFHSSTVEQGGLDAYCSSGSTHYYLWWEAYPSDTEQKIKSIQLKPGEIIDGAIGYDGGNEYGLELTVYNSSVTKSLFHWQGNMYQAGSNSSAECILEVQPNFNVADFGTGTFETCNGYTWVPGSPTEQGFDTTSSGPPYTVHRINMVRDGVTDVTTGAPYDLWSCSPPCHAFHVYFKHA
jgi:hypothetical protein